MGLMDKLRSATGGVSPELMHEGLLARGEVIGVETTGMSVSHGGDQVVGQSQVCHVTVNVIMDNTPPYQASVRQAIPVLALPQLSGGGAVVAVRVDPNDHSRIALDLSTDPPTVTISSDGPNRASAADLLASGTAARAVIIQSQPMGMRSQAGVDIYGFVLTILCDGHAPYQTQVGNAVPPNAVPLLYPGSNLPAKVVPEQQGQVAIDWDAALAEATHPSA